MANRRTFTDYEKKTVYANGNGRCAICGKPIRFDDMTVDHKISLSKGGTNAFENLQPSCRTCNLIKNSLDMDELLCSISQIKRHQWKMKIKEIFCH